MATLSTVYTQSVIHPLSVAKMSGGCATQQGGYITKTTASGGITGHEIRDVENSDRIPRSINDADGWNSWKTTHVDEMDYLYSQELPALSNTIVRAPAQYVESMPGKKIRDKAADALNVWLQVAESDLIQIKRIINLLHNASLILDDVEDGSTSRRGKPASHMVFGTSQAINSAGFQINTAMKEVLKLKDARCLDIFSEEMEKLYIGQGHDLFWAFNTKRPTVEEYLSMVDYKTGALFNMLVRLMGAKSTAISPPSSDLNHLVALLGRYFQIRDDYMNLTSSEYIHQKGFCEDLDEGKFSLILIHALNNAPEAECSILQHILSQRHIANGMSLSQKHLVLDILKGVRSLEYTATVLGTISQQIDMKIERVETTFGIENKRLRALLSMLKL